MTPNRRRAAALALAAASTLTSCFRDSPVPEGSWEFYPSELVYETGVGESSQKEFTLKNSGESYIEVVISRPIAEGNCPEEPFSQPPTYVRLAPNSAQQIPIVHRPTLLPASGACVFRVQLTRLDDVGTSRGTLRLDGGVQDKDVDGDGYGRGSGDCNDRAEDVNAPLINPGRREACNGIDDDCDNLIDDQDNNEDLKYVAGTAPQPLIEGQAAYLPDADGDTWPRNVLEIYYCLPPFGFVLPPDPATTANNGGYDCNDQVFEVYPGASELAGEGVDRNCDGLVNCFEDADGDGFGNDQGVIVAHDPSDPYCQQDGVSRIAGDCDDARGFVSPAAAEVCDAAGIDEDCDFLINDLDPTISQQTQRVWFYDGDGDGVGTPDLFDLECVQPAGYVDNALDCNDTNPAIRPAYGAQTAGEERCNGLDEDCDGVPDDGAVDPTLWYADRDGDGFGISLPLAGADTTLACNQPLGYVNNADDCDDANPLTNDYALDTPADGVDSNCDGFELCYRDVDQDGFGTAAVNPIAIGQATPAGGLPCILPALSLANNAGDCNDGSDQAFPGNVEACDGIDNDCDNRQDDDDADVNANTPYYRDQDGDGFGDPGFPRLACSQPIGFVLNPNDCDDSNPAANPGASEVIADGIDENCDGVESCYRDADNDRYGGVAALVVDSQIGDIACAASGLSSSKTDCNDAVFAINPGSVEVCDAANVDENCNGRVDDADLDPVGTRPYYADGDADGFGSNTGAVLRCDQPAGFVDVAGDCNDANQLIRPTGSEICNGTDDDCDGATDDADGSLNPAGGLTPAIPWYQDLDGDGIGNAAVSVVRCAAPTRTSSIAGDCADTNPEVRPGALEIVGDGIDQNCDNAEDCYVDADGDRFGASTTTTRAVAVGCGGAGVASVAGDCDDTRATVAPDQAEICDGRDNDCDRLADDLDTSVVPGSGNDVRWLRDADVDTYGDPGDVRFACTQPPGYIAYLSGGAPRATDCNDSNVTIYPGATEIVADGVDGNCDGNELCWTDVDGDRFGRNLQSALLSPSLTCGEPGLSPNRTDCDDTVATTNPASIETCDPGDEDCDGFVNDLDSSVVGGSTWFFDNDGDTTGNANIVVVRCAAPARFVADASDCNDNNASVRVGGNEVCDALNVDEDCDGLSDDADPSVSAVGKVSFYADADADGYGDVTAAAQLACDASPGQSRSNTDCEDANPSVRPGAAEAVADGVDSNCDGVELCYCNKDGDAIGSGTVVTSLDVTCEPPAAAPGAALATCTDGMASVSPLSGDCDDGNSATGLDLTPYFLDADGDGFGNPNVVVVACQPPPGTWVTNPNDCADNNVAIKPGGVEVCDGSNVDEDCDGAADNADVTATSLNTFYLDADLDGYGDGAPVQRCDALFNETTNNDDCDDTDPSVRPGGTDAAADGVDANCDGFERCYVDTDNDGVGSSTLGSSATLDCGAAANFATAPGDCNDNDAAVGSSQTIWYVDADGDTYGNSASFVLACTAPGATGWVTRGGDCADTSPTRNPAAAEACDASNLDEDCDGLADDADVLGAAPTGRLTFYTDADGDGYGSASVLACDASAGRSSSSGDCNDGERSINPGATEVVADGVDQTCDSKESCYVDADNDNYGTSVTALTPINVLSCVTAVNLAAVSGDCNDSSAVVTNTQALWFYDGDADGYGVTATATLSCSAPTATGWVITPGDCADNNSAVSPGDAETCNLTDDNCDGLVDNGATGQLTYYRDADADGYGTSSTTTTACFRPDGYAVLNTDCDDARATRFPGGAEVCDGLDNDCNAATAIDAAAVDAPLWAADADADGYGVAATTSSCTQPASTVSAGGAVDCLDSNAAVNPGAAEQCGDAVDSNCNGSQNDGAVTVTCYPDVDLDGFGVSGATTNACNVCPPGKSAANTDCNDVIADNGALDYPGAFETCDATDNNCNGSKDEAADCGPFTTRYDDPITDKVYLAVDFELPWLDAQTWCNDVGYELATWTVAADAADMVSLAFALLPSKPWIGYRYQSSPTAGWYAQRGLAPVGSTIAIASTLLPTVTGSTTTDDAVYVDGATALRADDVAAARSFLCSTPR